MELSALTAEPGVESGRIEPSATDVDIRLDGSWLFVLGHGAPGYTGLFKAGDYIDVSQSGDFTGSNQITFWPRTRPPLVPPPAGFSWVASICFDGVPVESRTISGSVPMDWQTWTYVSSNFNLSVHTLSFRLALAGPAPASGPGSDPLTEVEVPGFYVDNVVLAALEWPAVVNAMPDFGQGISTGSPASAETSIAFAIVGFSTPPSYKINPATIFVYVNGFAAIVNGIIQLGWSGTITSFPFPSTDQRTLIVLTPDTPFLSGATVSVSVQASDFNGFPIQPGPTVYSFAIADTTAPELLGASAQDVETVRVTWTEAVVAVSPRGANDALNPALYTFTPVIDIGGVVPAVPAGATSIAAVSGLTNTFDVTTSTELSPGILYSLAVAGVEDPSGNSEIALITFTAFTPPAPARRFFDLYRVLPRYNRDADVSLDLKRFVACIQEPATLLLYDIDRWTDILDVDIAAEQYLDAMLADLGNPFPFILSVTDKRRLIRLLVPIYQQKGTPDGIINTVRFFLGLTITIVPYDGEGMQLGVSQLGLNWILGPGNSFALYAFRIISGIALTAEQVSQITFIANYMKPAHTHLIEIVQPSTPPTYDPLELGISRLGDDWLLHA